MSLGVSKVIISGVWAGLAGEHSLELFTGAVPAGDQELLSGGRAAALGGHARLDCPGGSLPCLPSSLWLRVGSVVLAEGLEGGFSLSAGHSAVRCRGKWVTSAGELAGVWD